MLDVVCFKWRPPQGPPKYAASAVNALHRMVRKHYQRPHRLTCITDDAAGIDEGVRVMPLWLDHANLPSPHGGLWPSCYRRLRLFSLEAEALIGPRILAIDLDVVIVGDVSPLWDRPEDFVGLRDAYYPNQMNGSMWLLRAGSRQTVWTEFDPDHSPQVARASGFRGSDQAWMSHKLKNEATWGPEDGVYSYRAHCQKGLPKDARVTVWHGRLKPWDRTAPEWATAA